MDRRNYYLLRFQTIHQHTDRSDICNRIKSANLVKMNLCDRGIMCMALRLRNQAVYCHNIFPHLLWKCKMFTHKMLNIAQSRVGMCVIMGMSR